MIPYIVFTIQTILELNWRWRERDREGEREREKGFWNTVLTQSQ